MKLFLVKSEAIFHEYIQEMNFINAIAGRITYIEGGPVSVDAHT